MCCTNKRQCFRSCFYLMLGGVCLLIRYYFALRVYYLCFPIIMCGRLGFNVIDDERLFIFRCRLNLQFTVCCLSYRRKIKNIEIHTVFWVLHTFFKYNKCETVLFNYSLSRRFNKSFITTAGCGSHSLTDLGISLL